MSTSGLDVSRTGPIGWITYNNPARHNAISIGMQAALPGALGELAADDEIRVVIVRGAGERAFISGADISEFDAERSGDARGNYDEVMSRGLAALEQFPKPTVAMIHGYCLGGGVMTALLTDLRVADDVATFGIPAARLGVGYAFGATERLVATVGPAHANDILFTGRRLDADEARRIGLINRTVPSADLLAETIALAESIAANAPLTVRAAKAAVNQAIRPADRRELEPVKALIDQCWRSADYAEGRRAFAEKRTPRFSGR